MNPVKLFLTVLCISASASAGHLFDGSIDSTCRTWNTRVLYSFALEFKSVKISGIEMQFFKATDKRYGQIREGLATIGTGLGGEGGDTYTLSDGFAIITDKSKNIKAFRIPGEDSSCYL